MRKREMYILVGLFVALIIVGLILVFIINGINQDAANAQLQNATIRAIQQSMQG